MANELKINNVFLLEDNTIAVIDYESDYKKRNKYKYVRYINHVSEHYGRQWKKDVAVHMIVIYTADVERSETSDLMDAGSLKLETQFVFLSEMDSVETIAEILSMIEEEVLEIQEKFPCQSERHKISRICVVKSANAMELENSGDAFLVS